MGRIHPSAVTEGKRGKMSSLTWEVKGAQFHGRNGVSKCQGVHTVIIPSYDKSDCDVMRIYPITSKWFVGVGFIEIPLSKVTQFANLLDSVMEGK
jgi:hypothetical protein